ncbi:MAG: isoprenylcysteine carboxylmethyltransferase family protein [Sphingomonadales bacterium]
MIGEGAILLTIVTLQRLGELVHARRNTRHLLAAGGREIGGGHYPVMVLLHGSWLVALWAWGAGADLMWPWVVAYALLQGFRGWILYSLGRYWTTRIIITGEPLVRTGPYRIMRHPNYWLVAAEVACVPLALGLPWLALLFTLLNAAMLYHRIRVEDRALAARR